MAMTKMQYLLSKLAEECSELAQIALKAQQFGMDEFYAKMVPKIDNKGRMKKEFNDVMATINQINKELDMNFLMPENDLIYSKIKKIDKYLSYSQLCGQTEKDLAND